MFREMRRKKNELDVQEAKKLLAGARIGILAVNGDDGYPYAIPVNYYYDEADQKIYFHGSRAGHKADALKNCDKICFTVFGPEVVKEEAWAPYVKSAVVFGRCHPVGDPAAAGASLRKFAMKYYPDEALMNEEISRSGKAVQMYEIEMEHISGKEIQER